MIAIHIPNFNEFSEESYKILFDELCISQLSCSCGHAGCLIHHASYTRTLKTPNGTFVLTIQRLLCKNCGKTHAVLPDIAVPYSQLSVDCQFTIAIAPEGTGELLDLMQANTDIDESNIQYVKTQYRKHWKQRILSLDLASMLELGGLIECCYEAFQRQFMQIRRGTYLKFYAPT